MCEVESSGLTGNGMASSVGRLNISCPEGITSNKRDSFAKKASDIEDVEETVVPDEEEPSSGDLEVRRGSVGTREPLGLSPRISHNSIVDDSLELEGVDPFKPTEEPKEANGDVPKDPSDEVPPVDTSYNEGRRDSKTVSFKEPEIEELDENGTTNEVQLLNSTSSNGSTEGDGAVERKSSSKQRSLGESNPVYRLSMKLSPNLFNIQEIPGANQHRETEKAGYLTKLSGRSFPYIAQWKRRYCVLSKGRLYYYEREDSKPGEKSNGVINLEYFDQVTEAGPKDCKKATNVFIITSQDRSFFDPGRHLFSADTLPDMKDWVRKLQSALEQIRNNTRPATSTTPSSKKDSGKKGKEQQETENRENKENAQNSTKDRKKKKESHRPRKSARVGDGSDTPLNQARESPKSVTPRREVMTSSVGIQLPGMTSPRGVPLPGMSTAKKEPVPEDTKEMTTTTTTTSDSNPQNDEALPAAGPTLTCVTKQRNKGPTGRRAPQNRRTKSASALKKRASSLSALEYQDLNDNRSESSQGTRDSDRHSKTPENELEVVEENLSLHGDSFQDIDKDIFFSKKDITQGKDGEEEEKEAKGDIEGVEKREKRKETKRSSVTNENSGAKENHLSRSRSRNSSLFGTKLSRFRETMMTMKRSRFESKEPIGSDHPDDMSSRSGWSCSIL